MPTSKVLISYIVRYGGRCRDCADTTIGPICDGTGLPCGDGERAIQHVLAALAYGVKNGFIARDDEPDILSTARAEARMEALEEAVKIFDKQRPEWVTKKQGEYWDGYRDAIEDAIDEIRGVSTIARTSRAAALSELAAQDAELIDEPDPDLIRDDAHERRRMMKEYPDEE